MKRYLGVDLHRTQFTVCTRLENGRTYLRQWPLRELKLFAAQLKKEDEVAVESTGNTQLFYDAVIEHVARVAVVNPSQFKVISQSVKKTELIVATLPARGRTARCTLVNFCRRCSSVRFKSGWPTPQR